MIRKWDITDEQGDAAFGRIAAQEIIDIVASHLGPQVFNDTIDEVKRRWRKNSLT